MNTKFSLVVGGIVICTAAFVGAHRMAQWRRDRARTLADIPQQRAAMETLVRVAESRLTSTIAECKRLQSQLDELRANASAKTVQPLAAGSAPTTATTNSGNSQPSTSTASTGTWREQTLRDPRLQALHLNALRPLMPQSFTPLYLELNFSPEKIAQFEEVYIKRDAQLMDLTGASEAGGADVRTAVATLKKRTHEEFGTTLRALLGADWPKYEAYQRMRPARNLVQELAGVASLDGLPLTAKQGEQLMQAMAQASLAYARGGPPDLRTVNWNLLDAQAQQFLTPAQLALLKTTNLRAQARLDEAMAQAKKAEIAAGAREPRS